MVRLYENLLRYGIDKGKAGIGGDSLGRFWISQPASLKRRMNRLGLDVRVVLDNANKRA